jgi:cation diffusion facilitator family transporter
MRLTTAASLILAVLKLGAGIYTGSVAVLASAIDSFFDFLVSGFNVLAVISTEKPQDEVYNYGRGKMEALAATAEGLFILASAAFIARQAINKLIHPRLISSGSLDWAMGVMVVSLLAAIGIATYLQRATRHTRSLVIQSDAVHYRTDVYSNGAILVAMILIRFTGWQMADPLFGLGVAVYIAKQSFPLIRQGLDMLMDRSLPEGLVEKIQDIAVSHSPLVNGAHELKTRRSGDINFVELHLVFNEAIPLGKAHHIADEIEMRIRALEKAKWSVNIHLDPVDDSRRDRRLTGLR